MANHILTADIYFGEPAHVRYETTRIRARKSKIILPDKIEVDESMELEACVNHGRWIVRCPWCNSSSFANENELFLCEDCWNEPINKHVKALFPCEREQIEELLIKRPRVETRNWEPHEDMFNLEDENKLHGVD